MDRPAAVDRLAAMLLEKDSRATEVARLLHDTAGPMLSAIGFHLHTLGGDKEAAAEIGGYLEQVIENVRLACNKLQTNVVERTGLPLAIELLAERLRNETGLQIRLTLDAKRRLRPAVAHAVYRIMELALENVARHSGAAEAAVHLSVTETGLEGSIQDRGCGFAAKRTRTYPPGTGLVLMEAYAVGADLQLRVASTRSRGTIIRIQTI
jgi:signal transduction histidine kinase